MTATPAPTFDIDVSLTYMDLVVPYRCRKPRPEYRAATHTVRIPQVTAEQAPVVMCVPVFIMRVADGRWATVELRGFNGRLYAAQTAEYQNEQYPTGEPVPAGGEHFPNTATRAHGEHHNTLEDNIAAIDREYAAYLVIDGRVYVVVSEPTYQVTTFGLGSNHGGTALFIERGVSERAHPATDHAEAVAEGVQVATDRGDLASVPRIRVAPAIEVIDASYVTAPHQIDSRTARELTLLAKVAEVKAILDRTVDGKQWYQRLNAAQDALNEAKALAWAL